MDNRQDGYLKGGLIDPINDDARRLDQLRRAFNQARPADVRKTSNRQPIDAGTNAPGQFPAARGDFLEIHENIIEISTRRSWSCPALC